MAEFDNMVSLLVSDKFAFVQPDAQKFSLLTNMLNKRLEDGQGECFLELGIG
ncbi:hypothetical protein CLF_101055, partial [Clonorchis sinensis]